jgi:hypothetical protein
MKNNCLQGILHTNIENSANDHIHENGITNITLSWDHFNLSCMSGTLIASDSLIASNSRQFYTILNRE